MTSSGRFPSESERARALAELVARRGEEILAAWTGLQSDGASPRGGGSVNAVSGHGRSILDALRTGLEGARRADDIDAPEYAPLRELIIDRSRRGAREGATPSDTARGLLALREAIFTVAQTEHDDTAGSLHVMAMTSGRLIDAMALLSFENYASGREEIIVRQGDQLLELSTPVVRLWDQIIGVPLVGTLDSNRAQVVMESVLQALVDENAAVAIIDITGVPTVDTLVAQHLLKTVTATRLMGADCIISGIRPQTAQTMVQLGIDLHDITTRATLADALSTAISRLPSTSADPLSGR